MKLKQFKCQCHREQTQQIAESAATAKQQNATAKQVGRRGRVLRPVALEITAKKANANDKPLLTFVSVIDVGFALKFGM